MAARREMGIRTVFNMLGPLTNPAGANAQVIGVYAARAHRAAGPRPGRARHAPRLRRARRRRPRRDLEYRREPDLRGARGRGADVHASARRTSGCRARAIARPAGRRPGGERARSSGAILAGEPGPRRDIVLMNAAAALVVGAQGARPQGGRGAGRAVDRLRRRRGEARGPDRALAPSELPAAPRASGLARSPARPVGAAGWPALTVPLTGQCYDGLRWLA